ncbi:MAG: TetR/AcrR family transcriptional regulator [Acidobacteriota bacterium]
MRYAKGHREATRKKILAAASRMFREHGYDGVGVDAIMAEVGLTAGGFYSHFDSKEALFAESLVAAFDQRSHQLKTQVQVADDSNILTNLIYGYLSRTHRDMTGEGCVFPSLTADVVRGSQTTRKHYEKRLKQFQSTIGKYLAKSDTLTNEKAIAILVQLIGGVMLARAVDDEKFSNDILKACRQAALNIANDEQTTVRK